MTRAGFQSTPELELQDKTELADNSANGFPKTSS
jgi:hypothetical protein